jgi:hydroxyacylglutathione hydrolase
MTSDQIIIRQLEMGPMLNFIYVIGCARTGSAAVIDPAWDVPGILEVLQHQGLRLDHILLTHAHPDHVNGLDSLLDRIPAAVYIHADEMQYMKEMSSHFQIAVPFLDKHASRFQPVVDNQILHVGDLQVQVIHTPGHTPGSQCFLVEKNLFSGDTLFIDACGRVDFPGGNAIKMWESLRRLRTLDDDVVLYAGHSYGGTLSTIGEQKRTNPYMQFSDADDFASAMAAD